MASAYLRGHPLLLIMSLAPAIMAAVILAISFTPWVHKRIERRLKPLIALTYFVTRFVLFYVVFIALGSRGMKNDVTWFYQYGQEILRGEYTLGLAPLSAVYLAPAYALWNNPAAVVVVFILLDIVCLFLLCKLTRLSLGERYVLDAAWLYTINPAVWIITVRYGQDETVVSVFLLLCAYLYMRQSKWWQPILLAVGTMTSKMTTAVGMWTIWTYSKFRMRDAALAAAALLAVLVPLRLLGADIFSTLRSQNRGLGGVSITCLVDRLVTQGHYHSLVHHAGSLLAVVLVVLVCLACHKRNLPILECLAACLIAFLLFAPISFKFYRMWFLGPLGLYALRHKQTGRYALYTALLCMFDDFSFNLPSEPMLLYTNGALAAAIVCMEIAYLRQILSGKASHYASVEDVPST